MESDSVRSSQSSYPYETELFLNARARLMSVAKDARLSFRFADNENLGRVLRLCSREQLIKGAHYVRSHTDILVAGIHARVDFMCNRQMVWNTLKYFGFHGGPDLLDRIDADDIVEIYDIHGIQLFRNLRYFEFSSYFFEHLILYLWNELYFREHDITEAIVDQMGSLFSGRDYSDQFLNIAPHTLRELHSAEQREIVCFLKLRAGLATSGSTRPVAALTSLRAVPVNFQL